MICTEEEATEKWCPHVRMFAPPHEHTGTASYNRSPFENDPPHGVGCIGSRCMMWVWVDTEIETKEVYWVLGEQDPGPPEGEGWIASDRVHQPSATRAGSRSYRRTNPARRGTCGLIRSNG